MNKQQYRNDWKVFGLEPKQRTHLYFDLMVPDDITILTVHPLGTMSESSITNQRLKDDIGVFGNIDCIKEWTELPALESKVIPAFFLMGSRWRLHWLKID